MNDVTVPSRTRLGCRVPRAVVIMLAFCGLTALGGCATSKSSKGTWTILCSEMRGPNRVQVAEQVAESLRRTPGVRADEVFVMDGADGATRLYYGAYRRPIDPQTGRRPVPSDMRRDLTFLKELGTGDGRRYFLQAIPVWTPQQDVGNPEWDLRRVTAVYTLQVAAFEPTDDFLPYKQAAADYCAALREEGYEAYFHHGSSSSIVTVGLFGEDALELRQDGRSYYSHEVQRLQQDEKLKHNLVNGHIYKVKNDEGKFINVPSSLVLIPKETDASRW